MESDVRFSLSELILNESIAMRRVVKACVKRMDLKSCRQGVPEVCV